LRRFDRRACGRSARLATGGPGYPTAVTFPMECNRIECCGRRRMLSIDRVEHGEARFQVGRRRRLGRSSTVCRGQHPDRPAERASTRRRPQHSILLHSMGKVTAVGYPGPPVAKRALRPHARRSNRRNVVRAASPSTPGAPLGALRCAVRATPLASRCSRPSVAPVVPWRHL
jgi:hypothetical protein